MRISLYLCVCSVCDVMSAVLCMFLDITTYIVTELHILSIPNVWCVEPKK